MASCVPELTIRSTIAIVGSSNGIVRQIGTGTLLAVADMRFVVTAAHVILEAQKCQFTVGISGGSGGFFTALTGQCILSKSSEIRGGEDKHDFALYLLDDRQVSRLDDVEYVRIADVSFNAEFANSLFVITGFPGMWSTQLAGGDEIMKFKILQYGTYSFTGSTSALDGYDPTQHFLLQATPSELLDHEGKSTTFRSRSGHPAQFHSDLGGISGCSVWLVGNFSTSIDRWTKQNCKLVGVETGVFQKRGAIKATRWGAVASLLHKAFPTLRPSIELHIGS